MEFPHHAIQYPLLAAKIVPYENFLPIFENVIPHWLGTKILSITCIVEGKYQTIWEKNLHFKVLRHWDFLKIRSLKRT